MNKTVKFYWFIAFLSYICNFKNVFSEELSPVYYKGKYTSDIRNYEIVVPQRVKKDGSFISHMVSHHHNKRSTKELDFIFYKIPIGGKDYLIELTPNRKLISPGAVVETRKKDVRKSANGKFVNKSPSKDKFKKMFGNLDIRKLENTDCHFSGHVKGENNSKAALSTCYGLAGFIQILKGFYTIEPVAEHNPFLEGAYPHILYKADGLDNSSVCHTMEEFTSSLVDRVIRKRRESNLGLSAPIYIETLIVMDKTLINHHQDSDCENYVLTVFNMAFNLFHDASSGLMMTLTLVRLIRLEIENDEMNLKVNADAEKTLRHFQTWQYEINPGDDSHPNHHDIALLVTRVNVCYSPSACGLLGLTTIGKGCDPKLSAALCEDNGLRLGYVIAHEIGHLLGADHDTINSTCNGTDANGLNTVMHPHISTTAQTWSSCSQAYFKEFFSSGLGNCFFDEPEEHHFNVQDLLPGVMYNADFQCKHLITMGARECDMGSTCDSLNCYVPGYACIITHAPPADGTHCGENMWCHEGKCLVVGERPGAVDGNWGEWSAWSDCSRTCGSGVASSLRNCDKPQPSRGGKSCVGERKRYKICAATVIFCFNLIRFISEEVNVSFVGKPCQTGRPSFRDIQCGEFNDWIYPEDGKIHTWKAYFFHDDNPCTLYCINEEKQVAALRPRVVDGTMCYRGIRDICVAGTCKSLPCDLHFESNAVEDACGVCHGDGTNCEFSEGKETFSKLTKGLTKLVNVPSGTRNIKVEEMSPTLAKIIVRDKDTKDIYVRGKTLGMFNVPGSQAWLGMIKKNQEALNIPGPVTKPLSIWIQRLDNVTVKWSMALPAEQQRKPEFAWDFLKWGPCSAICGPGTQKSEPSCMEEKAGLVEDSFCADLEMPVIKVRQCEVTKCQPRWMVGDWKGCEPTSKKKERKRVVFCIKPIGEGEGESQIVLDSECTDPKPHEREPCENRQKREDTEYNPYDKLFEPDAIGFKVDTPESNPHKKYQGYLKHLVALSVPERISKSVPSHLVSSPHVRRYFHVPETPLDLDIDSYSDVNVNLPNVTSYDVKGLIEVLSDFLIESEEPTDAAHFHSMRLQSKNPLEYRPCKNPKTVNSNLIRKLKVSSAPTFKMKVKKAYRRSKARPNIDSVRKYQSLMRRFDQEGKRQIRFIKDFKKSPIQKVKPELFIRKKHKENFNYNFRNLTEVSENPGENDRLRYTDFINHSKAPDLPFFERTKLKSYEWDHGPSTKSFSQKLNNFFCFFSKNKANFKEKHETVENNLLARMIKPNGNEFDGSGLRRLPLTDEKVHENVKSSDIQNFMKKGICFAFMRTGRFNLPSDKFFEDRHVALEDSLQDQKKKYRWENKFLKQKETSNIPEMKSKIIEKLLPHHLYKQKRSSRIWKKPKSKDGNVKTWKESSGTCGGTETRNYLNNLFRDNHPKIFNVKPTQNNKPQELSLKYKKPVIKEGALVIDQDLAENQEIEIVFEDDETEPKVKKYTQLPHPKQNERKLVIKGQSVFNLFHELQFRPPQGAFYRQNAPENEKTDINTKTERKAEASDGNSTTTTEITSTTVATTTTAIKAANGTAKPSESSHQETQTVNSTLKTKQTEESSTEPLQQQTTDSQSTDNSEGCDYEVDEAILETPGTTTEKTNDKKKKKKNHKKKKKKMKKTKGDSDQESSLMKKLNKETEKATIADRKISLF